MQRQRQNAKFETHCTRWTQRQMMMMMSEEKKTAKRGNGMEETDGPVDRGEQNKRLNEQRGKRK